MATTNTITATYRIPRNNQKASQQLAQVNALAASGLGQADGSLDFLHLSQASFNSAIVNLGLEVEIVIVYNAVQPAFDADYPTQADAALVASNLWTAAIAALTKNLPCKQQSLVIA